MIRLKKFAAPAGLALVTISALLMAPLFQSAEAQGGNSILMTAELLNHGAPPDLMSSCSGVTTFPTNNTNSIIARFTGPLYEPCLNDIHLFGPDGENDLGGDDDVILVGGSFHAGRNKAGVVTSARLFFWDDDAKKHSTDIIEGVSSDPAVPAANACFTVHIDRTIAVRAGEKLGNNQIVVGSIVVDDLRACPLP